MGFWYKFGVQSEMQLAVQRWHWMLLANLLTPKPDDLTESGPVREHFRVLLSQRTSSELLDVGLTLLFPLRTTARPVNQSS